MRILLINDYGAPTGGAELEILMLREGFRQRGHDARLFTSSARPVPVKVLSDYQCFGTTTRLQTLCMTANPSAFFRLRRTLQEFRPEVVHVKLFLWQLSPLILPLLKNFPSLYHAVNYQAICPLGLKMLPDGRFCNHKAGLACHRTRCLPLYAWMPLMLQAKLLHRWRSVFKMIVANSHAVKRRLAAEGIEPAEVVWNGVPIASQRPPLSSPPAVAFAGRLVREKGVDVLLHAFARVLESIPRARLLLAGDGPERPRIVRLIDDLGLASAVRLTGHLTRGEMEARFATAWVQAVPSRWEETFGLVAIEAMMRGTAVVASDAGGLTEIVRDGESGFRVPPGDVDALARALLAILHNRELADEMGRAGRRIALAHFSESACVDKFLGLYSGLVNQRRRGEA